MYRAHPKKVIGGLAGAAGGGIGAGVLASRKDSSKTKTAAAIDEYLAANGEKHGRLGKKMASGDARKGMLTEFIEKNALNVQNLDI